MRSTELEPTARSRLYSRPGAEPPGKPESVEAVLLDKLLGLPRRWKIATLAIGLSLIVIDHGWSSLPGRVQEHVLLGPQRPTMSREARPALPPVGPASIAIDSARQESFEGLVEKVREAEAWLVVGGANSKNEALVLYSEVAADLLSGAAAGADRRLIEEAAADVEAGFLDRAISEYREAFRRMQRKPR